MAVNRLPYFPFFVDDYLADPAVMDMDADAEGCYCRLLFRSWRSNSPGIVFAGHVYDMGGLWRVAEQYRLLWDRERLTVAEFSYDTPTVEMVAYERIKDVMKQLEAGFTVASDGFWTQKRMVLEYERLSRKSSAHAAGAVKTNESKRLQQRARRAAKRALTATLSAVEVDSEVEREKRKDSKAVSLLLATSDSPLADPPPLGGNGPVAIATGTSDPGPAFWNHPDTQVNLARLKACGSSEADARRLVLAQARARGLV